tara:strand:- start:423 stop:692 length:270 start_codon:yes stop_codon:yes gene_type:complete
MNNYNYSEREMGDNDIDLQEVDAFIAGERLGLVDKIVGRLISRKFFVFLTATGLTAYSLIDSETWGMIAMIYIGGQSVIDAAIAWRHGR